MPACVSVLKCIPGRQSKDSEIKALAALNGVPSLVMEIQEGFLEKVTSRQSRNKMKWGWMLRMEKSFKLNHEIGQLI